VRHLAASGGDPSGFSDPQTRSTALHEAVLGGHHATALLLLSLGANASARDRGANTALHACAASGAADDPAAISVAETLISHGEPGAVAASNRAGATPLHLAASKGKLALIKLLVDHGAAWPLHDIAITNIVWCIAHKRGVGGGVVKCAMEVH